MLNHVPEPISLLDFIDDGEQARHYRFRIENINELHHGKTHHNWLQAKAGQFFMLNVPNIGEAPFTFTEPPNERGEFRTFIRKMGQVTSQLFSLQKGAILGARGPFGRGWPLDKIKSSDTLIIAGGCGLAPLVTLIYQLVEKHIDQESLKDKKQPLQVLIYGARNKATQMLNPERKDWQKHIKIFDMLEECDESETLKELERDNSKQALNLVTAQGNPLTALPLALENFTKLPKTALLCGPEIMMTKAANFLTAQGMASDAIYLSVERRMHCGVGLCGHCYINNQYVCKNGPTFSWQEWQQLNKSS